MDDRAVGYGDDGNSGTLRSLSERTAEQWAELDAEQLARAANLLDRSGLHCLSDRLYRHLLSRLPNDEGVIYRYALSAWSQGDPAAALDRGELVPVPELRHGPAIHLLTMAAIKCGEPEHAKRLLTHGLALPGSGRRQTLLKLAAKIAYWVDDDPELVIELARDAPEADPELTVLAALALGDLRRPHEAMKRIEPLLLDDVPAVDAIVCAFELMRRAGHHGSALRWMNLMLASQRMAPIAPSWAETGFPFEALGCSDPAPSDDERLVSVVMTMDRWHPLAATAIDSILTQTHRRLDLIVVVDGGSAADVDALRSHTARDGRVRIECLSPNAGTYVAKNRGMDLATGAFLAFMDSDDWSHPQRLQRALALLDRMAARSVAVCDDAVRLADDGSVAFRGLSLAKFAPISLVLRAECLPRIGRFDTVRCSADSEYCRRIDAILGDGAVQYTGAVTILQSFSDRSLTGGGPYAYDWRELVGDRFLYVQNYRAWHRLAAALDQDMRASGEPSNRLFEAPRSVLSDPEMVGASASFATMAARLAPGLASATMTFDVQHNPPVHARPAASPAPGETVSVYVLCHGSNRDIVAHAVSSLLHQTVDVAAVHLLLHEFDSPPLLPDDPRIRVYLGENRNDCGPCCPGVDAIAGGYVLLAGDEHLYPPDYVATMVAAVDRFRRRALTGVEATALPCGPPPSCFEELEALARIHPAVTGYRSDWMVNMLGLATLAFHTDLLSPNSIPLADPWLGAVELAVVAQRRELPMVSIRRKSNWIRSILTRGECRYLEWLCDSDGFRNRVVESLSRVHHWRLHSVPPSSADEPAQIHAGLEWVSA